MIPAPENPGKVSQAFASYTARLISRQMVGSETMLLHVEKPRDFRFLAGQFCLLTVPDMGFSDERGLRKPFSMASSPLEKDLLFVVKTSESALKRTMKTMPPGTAIGIDAPFGRLTLPDDSTVPLVFLAGGVGIAPFRSLILYAAEAHTDHRICLLYSGQTPEETPFLRELVDVSQRDKRISVIPTMTRLDQSQTTWTGLTGRINPDMIKSRCENWVDAIYYVVGPPSMATAMQKMLTDMDIPASRVKMELYT